MLTSAAMPSVIETEKSSKRRRLERLSRHAIFQIKEELIGGSSAPSLDGKNAGEAGTY
jgi:hypothetical protein